MKTINRPSRIRCLLSVGLLCFAAPLVQAQLQFLVAPQYAGGGYLWSAAVGDFNGDGKLDIVAANYGTNSVSVFLGNGDGTFASHVDYGVGFLPYAVVTGDFNGDGKLDLAVSTFSESAGVCSNKCQSLVSILLGNGDGTFLPHIDFYSGGLTPLNMATGDFNGDGKLDLVVSNSQQPGRVISVLRGNGDGTFQPPLNGAADISLGSIVVGDFNHDGKADLTVVSQTVAGGPTSLSILLGNGDGTFQAPAIVAGVAPGSVAVADLNSDGKPDLAVTGNSGVSVLLGNGDGTFQPPVVYTSTGLPGALVVADFNRDGKADLAVLTGHETVSILFGNGNGAFQPATDYVAGSDFDDSYGLVVGDFNGDKNPDLVLVDGPSSTATIILNNGTGGFRAARSFAAGNLPNALALADLNGDGKLDLVVANGGDNTVSALLGKGDGTFSAHSDYGTGAYPDSVEAGDLNGDGKLDVVVSNGSDNTVSVLLGQGNGTFSPHADYATGANPVSVALGDFNSDGNVDVVTANSQSNTVSILLGNGDGTLKAHVDYATGLQPVSVAVADLNGDGKPDLAVAFNGDSFDQKTTPGGVDIFINRGDGTFLPVVAYSSSGIPNVVAVGDFNADGRADLAVANGGNSCVVYVDGKIRCTAGASFAILLGNGDGTFQFSTACSTGVGPYSLAVADFNGDGKPDVVLANPTCVNGSCSGTTMSLHWGNGDGTLRPHLDYKVGSGPVSLAAGDLNGDSKPDLTFAVRDGNWPGDGATVLLNTANGPAFILSVTASSTGPDFGGVVTSQPAQISCGVLGGQCSAVYLPGTSVTLLADLEPGYSLGAWEGDCTGTNPCLLDMTIDRAVDAMFSASTTTFTLTINTAGSGTGEVGIAQADAGFQCPSQCSFTSASGSILNLGVVPDAGSTFGGWSGGGCTAGMIDCSVTLNSDISVTAIFNGSARPPDFSVSASALTPPAVSPGGQATSTVALSALNGFNSSVSLTCSVSPMPQLAPHCSLNPSSLSPGSSSTLTITTTGPSQAQVVTFRHTWPLYSLGWAVTALALLQIRAGGRERKSRLPSFLICAFLLTGIVVPTGCGGNPSKSGGGGTPPGAYNVTVTGTSGSVRHSTVVTLTVQ